MPDQSFTTAIPARLDSLRWSRFHTLLITALGTSWIIDGLEVTLVGSLASILTLPSSLGLSTAEVGAAASIYVAGAVTGALIFGHLADHYGRRKLFFVTLSLYILATVGSGFATGFGVFSLLRFMTGAGIGGEYAAINSAIQEFIPARLRGRIDLGVNGSFWIGAGIGAAGAIIVLNTAIVPVQLGWRLAFILGGLIGLVVLILRHYIPESPRWLLIHGHHQEAENITQFIESQTRRASDLSATATVTFDPTRELRWSAVFRVLLRDYPRRTTLGLSLMAAQAFLYNALFFTYALVLTRYYGVNASHVGWFMLPFAAGNFLGPLLLGPAFDLIGRRAMITTTYALTGIMIVVTGALFLTDILTAVTQTVAWSAVFFVASAAASAAYLTVSESFPLEIRASAIAWFYAVGTALGGIAGPLLFGVLIASGARFNVFIGYVLGGGLMLIASVVSYFLGIAAERCSLESIATPLTVKEAEY